MSDVTWSQPSISADAAARLVAAAVKHASATRVPVAVAVVDGEGVLKAFQRMDGAPIAAVDTCRHKACAALMGLGSEQLGRVMKDNLPALLSVALMKDVTLLGGGLPITFEDHLIGAIGVGGGTTDQDVAIATAALQALEN